MGNGKQNQNFQKQLENILGEMTSKKRLLLHSCCAPCSSYVLEYLSRYFSIWAFYYNPNITRREEYEKRVRELRRLVREMDCRNGIRKRDSEKEDPAASHQEQADIHVIEGTYEPELFLERVRGLEQCREGGERCRKCFELRLAKSAEYAAENGFDYYTTTLTISPLKNAALLNEIGEEMGRKYGISFLPSDFKKRGGYQRSIELSKEYQLYRQDYCGCVFSRRDFNVDDCETMKSG